MWVFLFPGNRPLWSFRELTRVNQHPATPASTIGIHVGGSSKGDKSKGVISKDFRPVILRWKWRLCLPRTGVVDDGWISAPGCEPWRHEFNKTGSGRKHWSAGQRQQLLTRFQA
jgi:hypothetical protein